MLLSALLFALTAAFWALFFSYRQTYKRIENLSIQIHSNRKFLEDILSKLTPPTEVKKEETAKKRKSGNTRKKTEEEKERLRIAATKAWEKRRVKAAQERTLMQPDLNHSQTATDSELSISAVS